MNIFLIHFVKNKQQVVYIRPLSNNRMSNCVVELRRRKNHPNEFEERKAFLHLFKKEREKDSFVTKTISE